MEGGKRQHKSEAATRAGSVGLVKFKKVPLPMAQMKIRIFWAALLKNQLCKNRLSSTLFKGCNSLNSGFVREKLMQSVLMVCPFASFPDHREISQSIQGE